MKGGYHVVEEDLVEEMEVEGLEEISFVKFLKLVRDKEVEKFKDYTVTGLETLVCSVENKERFLKYVKDLLTERSPYMSSTTDVFLIKIDKSKANIEIWNDKPVINHKDGGRTSLYDMFGSMDSYEDNPNWFWQQLNIES